MRDTLPLLLLLANAAATLFMTGVIWVIQLVHYPLFRGVGPDGFAGYTTAHRRRISWVVMPPMLVELATAVLLVWRRPPEIAASLAWLGLALVVAIWLSTFALQVPQHAALSRSFDERAHRRLVATNWLRTIAWSMRGTLLIWMLALASSP